MGDRTAYTPDIGDFSSVFQNGDLYLWDGMNGDSFGGWAPQGGVYMGMGSHERARFLAAARRSEYP